MLFYMIIIIITTTTVKIIFFALHVSHDAKMQGSNPDILEILITTRYDLGHANFNFEYYLGHWDAAQQYTFSNSS